MMSPRNVFHVALSCLYLALASSMQTCQEDGGGEFKEMLHVRIHTRCLGLLFSKSFWHFCCYITCYATPSYAIVFVHSLITLLSPGVLHKLSSMPTLALRQLRVHN